MRASTGHYEPIAREGYPFIFPLFILSAVLWLVDWDIASLFLLCLSLAVALFFRNPHRVPPDDPNALVSPADGRVMEVVPQTTSPNLPGTKLQRVSIFMSIFNVHVNRSPMTGTVKSIHYAPGDFLDAREPSSSQVNERNSILLQSDEVTIEVVQIAGKVARRIACWVSEGDSLQRGQRFGLIRFGSRLDVYLPEDVAITAAVGDRVKSGVSVIARTH